MRQTQHVSADYTYTITNVKSDLSSEQNVIYIRYPKDDGTSTGTNDYSILRTSNKTIADNKKTGSGTASFNMTFTQGSEPFNLQFYLRQADGEVTFSNVKVTKDVDVSASSIEIQSDYTDGQVLYRGESISLSALVDGVEQTEDVIWAVTGPTSANDETVKDYTDQFTIADGTLTYNNVGRLGDATGKVTVTASVDDKTATLDILTQRLRNTSYKITDASGDAPAMSVVTKVNGVEQTSSTTGTVTYAAAQKTGNAYSGNSSFEMTFTVPEGYTLTEDAAVISMKISKSVSGSTVTFSCDERTIDGDFYIPATLTRNAPTFTATVSDTTLYSGTEGDKAVGFITEVKADREAPLQKLTWTAAGHEPFTKSFSEVVIGENTSVYFGVIINGFTGDAAPEITAAAE